MPHDKFKSSNNPNKIERKFYKVWSEMVRRCRGNTSKRNDRSYYNKGIVVSSRWKEFDYFFIDMWDDYLFHRKMNNGDTELDRINNMKGYCKKNCRWSTRLENMNNISNVRIVYGKTLTEWAKILNIKRGTLSRRYEQGWSNDEIVTHPFGRKSRKCELQT